MLRGALGEWLLRTVGWWVQRAVDLGEDRYALQLYHKWRECQAAFLCSKATVANPQPPVSAAADGACSSVSAEAMPMKELPSAAA